MMKLTLIFLLVFTASAFAQFGDEKEFMIPKPPEAGALNCDGQPANVNHGKFWTQDVGYRAAYWSAWVKPVQKNITGYFASDGSGGAHNILLGGTTNDTHFGPGGNIFDGTGIVDLGSIDQIPLGDWVHYEFTYDGVNNLYVLINGVLSWTRPFNGVRKYPEGSSDGNLYVCGSFHNNWPGLIVRIRGIEGSNAGITTENLNVPLYYNGYVLGGPGWTMHRANFVADYSIPQQRLYPSYGSGFEGRVHHGTYSRYGPSVKMPKWSAGEPVPSTRVPVAPAVPNEALVFDSFSRVNNLTLFDELASMGQTEGGALGLKTWQGGTGCCGILYGRAVNYPSQGNFSYVVTDRRDVDLRVTRPNATYASTGLVVRYQDAQNYYKVYGFNDSVQFEFMENGIQSWPTGIAVSGGWTNLQVIARGGSLSIYVNGNFVGEKASSGVGTGHGIANGGGVYRPDNFTIFSIF